MCACPVEHAREGQLDPPRQTGHGKPRFMRWCAVTGGKQECTVVRGPHPPVSTTHTENGAYLSDGLHLVSYDIIERLNDCLGILVMGPRHYACHFCIFKLGGPATALGREEGRRAIAELRLSKRSPRVGGELLANGPVTCDREFTSWRGMPLGRLADFYLRG